MRKSTALYSRLWYCEYRGRYFVFENPKCLGFSDIGIPISSVAQALGILDYFVRSNAVIARASSSGILIPSRILYSCMRSASSGLTCTVMDL